MEKENERKTLIWDLNFSVYTEAYSEPYQTSKILRFAKIVNSF